VVCKVTTKGNVIRLYSEASLRAKGEANISKQQRGKQWGRYGVVDDGTETKGCTSKRGYLGQKETAPGVRAVIVALKLGNGSGVKGSRKMDE
jgi:hypothetical protein